MVIDEVRVERETETTSTREGHSCARAVRARAEALVSFTKCTAVRLYDWTES